MGLTVFAHLNFDGVFSLVNSLCRAYFNSEIRTTIANYDYFQPSVYTGDHTLIGES